MTQIIYLVLHINYQKKNNNNKNKKMQNFLTLIVGHFKGPTIVSPKGAMPTIVNPKAVLRTFKPISWAGIKVIGLMNIQQIKKVFSKINS